ncbi:BA14K family protein [Microbaculum marinisediminis]|uniref:Lectin-like protein BA14k n=1 Tax=Microbaculum marinisediminis TaxID=2931392 RepID=A0AAW5QQY3_9HYPH|nr:BA14K family protein [Microbaculum sp. A6E488]MCT8970380.1 BA14K family protein [Microbaculum sp. A6E488]
MAAKRIVRGVVTAGLATVTCAAVLVSVSPSVSPSVSIAQEWRAGGVSARPWNPGLHPDPGFRNDAAAAAAGAAAGIVAGQAIGNALGQPQAQPRPQPTAPPSSVTIVPPSRPVANPAMPAPSFPVTAGVYPPEWHAYCASKYPNYDAQTGTYVDAEGFRQYCQ